MDKIRKIIGREKNDDAKMYGIAAITIAILVCMTLLTIFKKD